MSRRRLAHVKKKQNFEVWRAQPVKRGEFWPLFERCFAQAIGQYEIDRRANRWYLRLWRWFRPRWPKAKPPTVIAPVPEDSK